MSVTPGTVGPDDVGGNPALAGYPVTPPPLTGPVTFDQRWSDLTFVHWPVRPDSVAHMFPPGTRPDVFVNGLTYVALVPFVKVTGKFTNALCQFVQSTWNAKSQCLLVCHDRSPSTDCGKTFCTAAL